MSLEGDRRLAHLARAARTEVVHRPALAEIVDGSGERQDRPDLVAQEGDRDRQEHEAGADHPGNEDHRIGGVGLAASGKDLEEAIVELDADLDEIGATDRVDPERTADAAGDLSGERAVEKREERLAAWRRQRAERQDGDVEAEILAGEADDLRVFRILRIGLQDVDERRNVGDHRRR